MRKAKKKRLFKQMTHDEEAYDLVMSLLDLLKIPRNPVLQSQYPIQNRSFRTSKRGVPPSMMLI